jgi:Glycosyl transferase family 2
MASDVSEIVMTLATGQDQFLVELAEVIEQALAERGRRARIAVDEFPEPSPASVPVLIEPTEYTRLAGFVPPPELLAGCVGITLERPGDESFDASVGLGRQLGSLLEVNPRAIRAYETRGVHAKHLPIGHSRFWDRYAADQKRDIDVLFLGCRSDRRDRALAFCADAFEPLNVHLQISDGSRPNVAGAPDVISGEDKRALLARSKVMIVMHRDELPDLEWLRVAEGICAGALIVSEHSSDIAPLTPSEHLITGGVDRLGLLCAWAVRSEAVRMRIAQAAYELLRTERSADRLADAVIAAAEVAQTAPSHVSAAARLAFVNGRHDRREPELHPPPSGLSPGESRSLRALKSQTAAIAELRRRLERVSALSAGNDPETPVIELETPSWRTEPYRAISVVIPVYNHADDLIAALDSLTRSDRTDYEVVVVDDGSTDQSAAAAVDWVGARPEIPTRVVRHPVNRGLAHARNTGVEFAATDLLLMLDADNELRATAIRRLMDALGRDPDADFAYGILERFDTSGPIGLASQFPWEPSRLRGGNYIDALALIRRSSLSRVGGYSTDARLALGWEDYDLWARLADLGGHAAFVPEIIARYRVSASSMVSVTDISSTEAFAAIAEHAPTLMRDLQIPA